jgi:hypothetical protein
MEGLSKELAALHAQVEDLQRTVDANQAEIEAVIKSAQN